MWILDSLSSLGFSFRFTIRRYPIRCCLRRELDVVAGQHLNFPALPVNEELVRKKEQEKRDAEEARRLQEEEDRKMAEQAAIEEMNRKKGKNKRAKGKYTVLDVFGQK